MDEFNMPVEGQGQPEGGAMDGVIPFPALHIPKPFVLSEQDPNDMERLVEQSNQDVEHWESRMTTFFGEYDEFIDSWRVMSRKLTNKPRGIFNSKSGETHRAVEALATLWHRMLFAADPFFEAQAIGYDPSGNELTSQDLYSVEALHRQQLTHLQFKTKFLKFLRSLALFGTAIGEAPFIRLPYGGGNAYFEGTDFVQRSLLTTGFDPFVYDINDSDYIFTIDFPTFSMLRNMASNDPELWDLKKIEAIYSDRKDLTMSGGDAKSVTYSRVVQRKQRAGYNIANTSINQMVTRHGRLDVNNSVVARYWESQGFQDDPKYCDFTVGTLGNEGVVRFHHTPFKTWRHLFKIGLFKSLELEGYGYGVGKLGRKKQREIDATESRINDTLMFSLLNMWKFGKFAGLNVSQLTVKPWAFVEMEDINQLEPIRPQIEAIANGVNMQNLWKEDFRNTTGASSTLQADITRATATESSITQNEAIRRASVHAETIADSTLRPFLESAHINNLNYLDAGMWVKMAGMEKPVYMDKNSLPVNIGFLLKVTTDKDFRPDRLSRLLEALQISTSIRNIMPQAANLTQPIAEEIFRALGLNPRLLNQPVPIADQLNQNMKAANMGGGGLPAQMMAEAGGSSAGAGGNVKNTPVGPVATSPVASSLAQGA